MNYNNASKTVSLFSQPYLDKCNQCYKNIITVNLPPQGPLGQIVRRIQFYPLSTFKQPSCCEKITGCGLGLMSLNTCVNNGCDLMLVDEVPDLFSYLVSNGYTIDTKITNMLNASNFQFNTNGKKLICFITYQG